MIILRSVTLIFCGLFFSISGYGSDGQSRFHWIDSKCEIESHEKVETSPQSPPLDVDDPGTPGCNQWEINVVMSGNFSIEQQKYELPLLDINYGIGDNIQLKYEVPNTTSRGQGDSVSIVGSSKLGVKYEFYESEEDNLQLGFYPQFEFITPKSKAVERGLESPGNIYVLPLLLSKKLGQAVAGDVMLTANIGYDLSTKPDTSNFFHANAGVGLPLSGRISVMGELSTEQAIARNRDNIREQLVKVNIGAFFKAFKGMSIFGSVGQSLVSSDGLKHTYVLTGIRI